MKKIIFYTLGVILVLSMVSSAQAANTYTVSDVAKHSTTTDCWMIFENKVYNVTSILSQHDGQFYDISPWCGKDMTVAFSTKDGAGRDHRSSTYSLLNSFYIGDISAAPVPTSTPNQGVQPKPSAQTVTAPASVAVPVTQSQTVSQKSQSPYNVTYPLVFLVIFYLLGYYISGSGIGKEHRIFSRLAFNYFWNTVLLLSLVPSLLFGLFLVLEYQYPSLRNIGFNFLYWHVEGGIVLGTVVVMHFLQRSRQYLAQKRALKPKVNTIANVNE